MEAHRIKVQAAQRKKKIVVGFRAWLKRAAHKRKSMQMLAFDLTDFEAFLTDFTESTFKENQMIPDFAYGCVFQLWNGKNSKNKPPSLSSIARAVGISRGSVKKIVESNFVRAARRQRQTPPNILKRRAVLRKLVAERSKKGSRTWPKYSSASQLKAALCHKSGELLSTRQVTRELHSLGFKPYVRQPHPTRTAGDLCKRRAFAKRMRSLSAHKLKSIVFTDESWLSCVERTGKVQWTTSRKNVYPLERKARWNVPSVLIWGAVGHNYKSELIIFPAKRVVEGESRSYRLNATQYVRRCLSKVVPDLLRLKKTLQHDGARSHIAKSTVKYLHAKKVDFIDDWSGYSPDLNAIERVWKELNTRVGELCPMTTDELIASAHNVWAELDQEMINNHCAHFANQILAM